MALRLINRSLPLASLRPALAISYRAPAVLGARKYATANDKQLDPKSKATSIIDSLPGNSIISKTGYLTVGAGLASWLISKEIYVINEESLVLATFTALMIAILKYGKEPYNEWADEEINRIKNVLIKAREDHKKAVTDRIDSSNQLRDIVDVTKGLFALSKETAQLESEAFELKQKVAVTQEIKSVLDSWVRYEASVREAEQKRLVNYLMEKVQTNLQDPKVQQQILAQALVDVERLVKA